MSHWVCLLTGFITSSSFVFSRENPFVENIVEDEGAPSDIQMELEVPQGLFLKVPPSRDVPFLGRSAVTWLDYAVSWKSRLGSLLTIVDMLNSTVI
ncbi:unnamed protein product [Cylicocyclus nassatus]|uniref:Uncharacterized protein n=1 Tax=Cylicocyclus nassatus TaxID=53992 RepID=A0AA36GRY3_CYLNA|nr:unnamed protein product [Cylicocyclus nassatus]